MVTFHLKNSKHFSNEEEVSKEVVVKDCVTFNCLRLKLNGMNTVLRRGLPVCEEQIHVST